MKTDVWVPAIGSACWVKSLRVEGTITGKSEGGVCWSVLYEKSDGRMVTNWFPSVHLTRREQGVTK